MIRKFPGITNLMPAFGKDKFFFQDEMNKILMTNNGQLFFDDDDDSEVDIELFA